MTGPEFLNVVTRDRFGLTESIQQFPLTNILHVHPPSERIQAMLHAERTRSTVGDHRSNAQGPGMELAEVRAYQSGDPVRRIHPGLSLRRGKPMVADRYTEQASDVVLFVDVVQDVGEPLDSTLRSTIAAAIGLQQRHFRSMDRVGILDRSTGVRWLPPSLGRRAGHIIVDTLLSSRPMQDRRGDLPTVPTQQPRRQIPHPGDQSIAQRGLRQRCRPTPPPWSQSGSAVGGPESRSIGESHRTTGQPDHDRVAEAATRSPRCDRPAMAHRHAGGAGTAQGHLRRAAARRSAGGPSPRSTDDRTATAANPGAPLPSTTPTTAHRR